MKKILGLDLGTNSIGWAVIKSDFDKKQGEIVKLGSRIIPMSQDILGKFDAGVSVSQTADRTAHRSVRRINERSKLRRERLHRVLNILGFLPEHYAKAIDFEKNYGQFKNEKEVKINYKLNEAGKHEFIFKDSFDEMANEFAEKGIETVPYDWTIYYLRKKALSHKVSGEELAWILLNFNQKRGYYQLRGEEIEDDKKESNEEYHELRVKNVMNTGDTNARGTWYEVTLENDWIYKRQSKEPLDNWIGTKKEFIVTTKTDKKGTVKRSFRSVDSESDWIAIKKKTEQDIQNSDKTVGEYIYDTLLDKPSQKIRGKLIRTIERKLYKDELKKILGEQIRYHPELQDEDLFTKCVEELYPRNEGHKQELLNKDEKRRFIDLFVEDIIFYQRPLRSQKSNISNCQYEFRTYLKPEVDEETGMPTGKKTLEKQPIKATPRSNPYFQEFRIWQFLRNLRIKEKDAIIDGKPVKDHDITNQLLPTEESWVDLFEFFNSRKEIDQKQFLGYFANNKLIDKKEKDKYRWNYVEDKSYPLNETKALFLNRLAKVPDIDPDEFLTKEREYNLWHMVYSIKDKKEFEKALGTFATKNKIDEGAFVKAFKKIPPFDNEYAAYSEKAIKKLLPLMRIGKYWKEKEIPEVVKERAEEISERLKSIEYEKERIDDFADDYIPRPLLKSFVNFGDRSKLKGLNTYQACYLVYNRHSETSEITRWKTPEDISNYISSFKQHSLRNPIVEQVVTETLRVVKDIWEYYGSGKPGFFNEVHIELGREMKNPANIRKQISTKISENENTNHRIRELLTELMNDSKVEGEVRPYSPSHQEILKIYEEGVYQNPNADYRKLSEDDVEKIRRNNTPTRSDIQKYKLWLEQGYISPYTGKPIPLSKLFTTDYQIEHVIPQSRYFDDSLSNKIICESEINQLKDNRTAYQFLKEESGRIYECAHGKTVKLLTLEDYTSHCNKYFKRNRGKLKKLLSEEIPEGFIERQMTDSRYISKLVKTLLSNLVREENEQEAISKHVMPVPGSITSILKNDWGLNDKWNEIVAPRFQRLNELTKSNDFGYWDKNINAFRCTVPEELAKGFSKKRIDHRHHALDALVVACTTKDHISYITSLNTERQNYSLVSKLRKVEERQIKNPITGKIKLRKVPGNYHLPWDSFPKDAKDQLEKIIVSFKQNIRIINKSNNKTWQWVTKNGKLRKEKVKQTKGENWAIRKPMHKDTVSGFVKVRRKKEVSFNNGIKEWESLVDKKLKSIIRKLVSEGKDQKDIAKFFRENPYKIDVKKVSKVEMYFYTNNATATRIALSDKFSKKQLQNVTDSCIRKILNKHVKKYFDKNGKERFDLAFSPEGIEEMNNNIQELNGGKAHQPIYKVRVYEEGNKFSIGETGNKRKKFVEAAKGTNLFFAIYWNEEKQKREYETIPLNEVIAYQKWKSSLPVEEQELMPIIPVNKDKSKFLFTLSPEELVYLPTEEELDNAATFQLKTIDSNQTERIYKMVSSTGSECHFVQSNVATLIKTYDSKNKFGEFGSLNKMEVDLGGENRIKEKCWKIENDRLGNIIKVITG